ncbi:MAG: arsenite methyltransferase [Armatimonadetes bacterium]|nr:arsenite methyltransferase [Armatimonadota bacterium]
MSTLQNDKIRQGVRKSYAGIAEAADGSCCGTSTKSAEEASSALGYSTDELKTAPDGANLGLGCGNPQAISALKPGETVVDLGSGGGFDCFLAAKAVGKDGRVIGVDMTPEMVTKARENALKSGVENVEFRLGEIESLPVADNAADVVISNCVINLSPEKPRVFEEAFRVLKSGGRLAVFDMVAITELPKSVKDDPALYSACVAGAVKAGQIERMLQKAGFEQISITPREESACCGDDCCGSASVVSTSIAAVKP